MGIPRADLNWVLRDPRRVMEARRANTCLLCRATGVSEAGICEVCYAGLDGESLRLAVIWRSGVGPPA